MNSFVEVIKMEKRFLMIMVFVIVSSFVLCGCTNTPTGDVIKVTEVQKSTLDKVKDTKVLRVGYAGYPPYLKKDPLTGEISGFSVDLLESLMEKWGRDIEIEWVETTWERNLLDLQNGKFDLMIEPVYRLIPRASEVGFTRPYSYFGYCVGVVKQDEDRFDDISDLNNPDVTIAVMAGSASSEYIRQNLPLADVIAVSGTTIEAALQHVPLGKADVALADAPTVGLFVRKHKGLKPLFLDNPPAKTPAGFMFKLGDYRWAYFLDTSLDFLETSGEIKRISDKYNASYYERPLKKI